MHCHLLISSLFPPRTRTRENDPLYGVKAPALQVLLARGVRTRSEATDSESWLCETFGAARAQDYPVASLSALADGVNPGDHYWLCADPVHLSVERDQLILAQVAVEQHEADELLATLNQHFAADGLHFVAPTPGRWYLRLARAAAITTHGLYQAAGKDIHPLLPDGGEAMHWRALLNEIQMLLFDHPVNAAREARGSAPLNSVWPWGGGVLPKQVQRPFDQIWANDPLANGLSLLAGIPKQAVPEGAAQWLERATTRSNLAVLDDLRLAASYGDPHAWRNQLEHMERLWFAPLKRAVGRGQIQLTLHAPTPDGTLNVTTSRGQLWKPWRSVRPLEHYRNHA